MATGVYGPGTRTLTPFQVGRLAAMVRRRIEAIGDPAIRAPLPGDYLAERHFSPSRYFDLSVDIDIGSTVLTLLAPANWPARPELGPGADLVAISDAIIEALLLMRGNDAGFARLSAVEKVVRSKMKRDGLDIELVSVRFAPASIFDPEKALGGAPWVRVTVLDDVLHDYTEIISEWTSRRICRALQLIGEDQARRRFAREMLEWQDAVLEIEAAAEHAIGVSGRSVGEVARAMFEMRTSGGRDVRRVTLWGHTEGNHVSVTARGGCICLEARLGTLDWTHHSAIIVDQVFPESVTIALVGRPLRTLVEHPYLLGDAEIAEAERFVDSWTEISVKSETRAISHEEIWEGTTLAA